MKLRDMYAEQLEAARALAAVHPEGKGASGWRALPRGAQFAVRVAPFRLQVVLARHGTPVGHPTEERVFCEQFDVPASAEREDHGQDGTGWYRVSYTWQVMPAGELPGHV